jgi:hypothetical protein
MNFRSVILVFSFFFIVSLGFSQYDLPIDPQTGKVVFTGNRSIEMKSKKKIMLAMEEWVSKKLPYPPMVFSVIEASKDTLMVKAVTEVPSLNELHPISFRLILVPKKKAFWFQASEFYFEDIRLSLDKWLEKYGTSTNKRHVRNVEVITKGIDSHVFLSMKELVSIFNKK